MHSVTIISALAALLTLTVAAPHANGLAHHRLHARNVNPAPIAGRSVLDGVCGGASGFTCEPGYCCSQWGYCGTSEDYCGAGCNLSFGQCSAGSSTPAPVTNSTSAPASTITIQSTIRVSAIPSVTADSSVSVLSSSKPATISRAESSSVESISVAEATKYHTQTLSALVSTTFATVTQVATAAPTSFSSSAARTTSQAQSISTSTAPPSSSVVSPAAVPTFTESSTGANVYKLYIGDGTIGSGWPSQGAWVTFESMWSANMKLISSSCTEFGQANNSDEESNELKSAIQSISSTSGIDARFILAVVMQESKGCVRAPTTNYGVRNPGLMQDHDGSGTCNDASVSNPCPATEIQQMIKDGTTGTPAGDGLEQCMNEAGGSDVSKYYRAARIYNSGSVTGNNLGLGVATHCYASDIANRLLGWVDAPTACFL